MPRVIMRKDGKPYTVKTIKVLKPCYDKDGYLRIELNNNGVAKNTMFIDLQQILSFE